ncbi:FecR domain-containing protein [Chitinophaga horti]|uniref:FecR domain-containing protein n=1 Tax=Chitinophaga horti TaxID=2920382 RepID=A0ABY6IWH5_9BACT|nr:FecR family protein [Chitinophaga horti]UYQ91729.1 FecR domain-containing protein [Chitinophaga horti]
MDASRFKKILKKYYNNEATDAEQYFVDCWYESYSLPEDQQPVMYKGTPDEVRARIFNKIIPPIVPLKWYKRSSIRAIAAVLAGIGILTPLLWNYIATDRTDKGMEAVALSTGDMQVKKITLPDSTAIWLNANSTLTVAEGFGATNRSITLDGEAFFDVQQNAAQPFVIATGKLKVKVLGTAFNVNAYPARNGVKVIVNNGKVQVSEEQRALAVLTEGQGLNYDRSNGRFEVAAVHAEHSNGWTEGRIVLEKASFEELAQAVHNLYGIELRSEDKKVTSFKYNLTLRRDQPQQEVMDLIATIVKKM